MLVTACQRDVHMAGEGVEQESACVRRLTMAQKAATRAIIMLAVRFGSSLYLEARIYLNFVL